MTGLLRQLRLGPWLDRLDHGPDTVLAPWGQPVSGGELQCLSAATADAVLQAVLERTAGRSGCRPDGDPCRCYVTIFMTGSA